MNCFSFIYGGPLISTSAQAVDINISGMYDFTAQWGRAWGDKNDPKLKNGASGTNNTFYQRFRTQIDIIASESLQGVLFFEIGDQIWGKSAASEKNTGTNGRSTGGGLGADGVTIEVRRAYIDWIIPQTELQVRIGIQGFSLPNLTGYGSQVFDDDVAGITAAYQFNDTVGLTAFWLRPFADNNDVTKNGTHNSNKMDMLGISVPLTFDGVKVTPWGMWAHIGRDAFDGYDGATSRYAFNQILPTWFNDDLASGPDGSALGYGSKAYGNGWWGGISADVTLWNPFRFAVDFNYGSVDMGHVVTDSGRKADMKRRGWIVSGVAEYKLDFMTPGIVFWYGSGDDSDAYDGSEMMPTIKASSKFTSFGQDGSSQNFMANGLRTDLAGTWGIGAQLKDITFIEDLKHTFRVAYYRGTNHRGMTDYRGGPVESPWESAGFDPSYIYMTKNDSAWEFNLDTTYDIYKNLQLGVELGYIKLRLSESNWGRGVKDQQESMYKVGVGLRYTF